MLSNTMGCGGLSRYERMASLRPSIFGEILLCLDRETQEEVVVKTVDLTMALKQESRQYGAVKENILKEIEVMSQLCAAGGHPNIINMRNYYVSKATNMLHIVLDYCEGGDLLEACTPSSTEDDEAQPAPVQKIRIDEKTALGYLKDVVSGLSFLHRHGIAHRDLSLENMLLRGGRAVIGDFGLCAQQEPNEPIFRCDDIVGKHYYMAPEVVAQTLYDPMKADVWSVAISFFILLTSSPPFEMASPQDAGFRYIAKNGLKAVFKAWNVGHHVSEATQDLLERMTSIDPALRPSAEEIMAHPALVELARPPVASHGVLHPCAATAIATEAA
jgi:serine/threonine protein kinase